MADFVFELVWQLVEDRLTAHLLHNGNTGPVVQAPVPILPLSICPPVGLCVSGGCAWKGMFEILVGCTDFMCASVNLLLLAPDKKKSNSVDAKTLRIQYTMH